MLKAFVFCILLFILAFTACSTEPKSVEVTRVVEIPVEVTRIVTEFVSNPCELGPSVAETVEVTRIVEVSQLEVTRIVIQKEETLYKLVEVTRLVPAGTATPEYRAGELRTRLSDLLIVNIENNVDYVDRVNAVRWYEGRLEIEIESSLPSEDSPRVSWEVITYLADEGFGDWAGSDAPDLRVYLTGSEELIFTLIVYSDDGEYRYQSETNVDAFAAIKDRAMSRTEWMAIAFADFR